MKKKKKKKKNIITYYSTLSYGQDVVVDVSVVVEGNGVVDQFTCVVEED